MGGKYMNVTRNSDNVVNALIEHEKMRGGFQQETSHKPLKATMNKEDASFTITTINDTEA